MHATNNSFQKYTFHGIMALIVSLMDYWTNSEGTF